MDELLNKATALSNLLDYVQVDENAASVLHALEGKISEKLQAMNYQPTMYIMYTGDQNVATEQTIHVAHIDDGTRRKFRNKVTQPKVISNTESLKKQKKYTDDEKRFACALCDYRAARKDMVKQHMKIHTGEKPFECNQCEYRTAYKGDLVKHLRKHSGERPYKCGTCNTRFSDINGLRNHMRIHSGEKPYKCSFCVYRANQAASVRTHIRLIHMRDRPFKCNYCNYSTGLASSLKVHERTHTGEKPFACAECDFRGASRAEVKKHFKVHNPGGILKGARGMGETTCNLCDSGITHTDGDSYKCPHCDYIAEKCYDYYSHVKAHGVEIVSDEQPVGDSEAQATEDQPTEVIVMNVTTGAEQPIVTLPDTIPANMQEYGI